MREYQSISPTKWDCKYHKSRGQEAYDFSRGRNGRPPRLQVVDALSL
jgi:hypothetical protein